MENGGYMENHTFHYVKESFMIRFQRNDKNFYAFNPNFL